jgi:hypothetical protein
MIIHDLNVIGVPVSPNKADTPLIVDPNAVLPFPVSVECFEAVPRRRRQVAQLSRNIQLAKFSLGHSLNAAKSLHPLPGMEPLRLLRPKGFDHRGNVITGVI